MATKESVVIEEMEDGTWGIYDESGIALESDFTSEDQAKQYAKDNDYKVVYAFSI